MIAATEKEADQKVCFFFLMTFYVSIHENYRAWSLSDTFLL